MCTYTIELHDRMCVCEWLYSLLAQEVRIEREIGFDDVGVEIVHPSSFNSDKTEQTISRMHIRLIN